MDVTSTARTVLGTVTSAAQKVRPGRGGADAPQQSLTFSQPLARVDAALRDPEVWSQALGEFGRVDVPAGGTTYVWSSTGQDDWSITTTLQESPQGPGTSLRFVRDGDADDPLVELRSSPAPADRGTAVQLRLHLPVPDLALGAVTFTVLYRLRAFLQTGEVPTTTPQPSARSAQR